MAREMIFGVYWRVDYQSFGEVMRKSEKATVVFLRDSEGRICLARKKQDVHKANGEALKKSQCLNGYGGKQEEGETILETAIRELEKESGGTRAEQKDLQLAARINFFWPGNNSGVCDMEVYFFFLDRYECSPEESDEMEAPQFFFVDQMPWDEMMPADQHFLPKLFRGEKLVLDVRFTRFDRMVYLEDKKAPLSLP